ncbi:MAG: hypothetical protein JXJ22_15305 [Bacteroidales bacterium]|nr:hypothetical protein [Bacteroidales bacterium]
MKEVQTPAGLIPENLWLPLDNAAKIFPAILNKQLTGVFRLSVILKERIKIKYLFQAVSLLENRFPYYKVQLKKGFFWYYLEKVDLPISVEFDNNGICRAFKTQDKKSLLFRVLVDSKTVSVEFSHMLTDGFGAFEFLRSVLFIYFEKCGIKLPENLRVFKPGESPSEGEYEDSYNKYFQKDISPILKVPKAFHLPFPLNISPRFEVFTAILPLDSVLETAKTFKVSITEYLVSVYLFALQEIYNEQDTWKKSKNKSMLRIQVPINLRGIFPSISMRNFSLFVMPEIDLRLGHYTFEEIVKKVYHLMQLETDEKLINKIITRNVRNEKNPVIRSTPLFFKSLMLYFKYYSLGTSLYTGVISNMGKVKIAPEIDQLIDYFAVVAPPPNKVLKVNCGVIGFNNHLVMSFGNITSSKDLENKYMSVLKSHGIKIQLKEL